MDECNELNGMGWDKSCPGKGFPAACASAANLFLETVIFRCQIKINASY
jgi:hypothetical protein